ncbi:hypothetical protein [Haliscomenobacter sp.]|uniref:hypothetical protein n=1 Tax=Haliscomenobacter sp. TaxID=2717303 RepID=UPI0035948133
MRTKSLSFFFFYILNFYFCLPLTGQDCQTPNPFLRQSLRGTCTSPSDCISGLGDLTSANACNNSENYAPLDPRFTPIKTVRLIFHVFQNATPGNPQNFQNITAHVNYLNGWVNHSTLGLNAKFSGLCSPLPVVSGNPSAHIPDSRIRFSFNPTTDLFFWQDSDAWASGHYYCNNGSTNGPFNFQRSCDVFDEYVTNNNQLTATQKDALHVFFAEASTLDDGTTLITGGGFASGIANLNGRNYIMLTARLAEYTANGGALPASSLNGFTHEVGHALGLFHPFDGDYCNDTNDDPAFGNTPNNYMSYAGINRCSFTQDQLGRMHWILEGKCLGSQCPTVHKALVQDFCSVSQPEMSINSGENITWNSEKKLNCNLRIKTGGTLTIKCKIGMPELGKIIIEKGGKLVVDGGTITKNCTNYWTGIEVIGNPALSQTAANQGTLELKNNTIIEFANNAITTGTNGITWEGGGIIKADNTTFRNNRRSVEFVSYNIADNVSYFSNCIFELTTTYPQTTYIGHATIWDNYGIPFTTCTFRNLSASVTDKKYGIYTIDAGYQALTGCSFNGFTSGIYGTNSSTSRTFSVSTSTFSNNALGIYAGSVNNMSATYNTFNVGQYRTGTYNHGVFVSISTGYIVQNNSFSGSSPTLTPQPVGVLCSNTGDATNIIRDNSYTGLYAANKSDGDNRNNSNPANGLKYLCNLNTSNHSYDFLVSIDPLIGSTLSGIATPQGSSSAGAGNKFSLLSTPTGSDFSNFSSYTTQYYYRSTSGENPANTTGITKILTSGNPGCSSSFARGGGSLASDELLAFQNEYNAGKASYDNESQIRNSKIDNGDTKALLVEVDKALGTTSTALEEKLLNISPWLSSEVLERVLDKKDAFTASFIQKILAANPDALYNFTLQQKMQKTLTADQLSEVKTAQANSTERSALESRLAQAGTIVSTSTNAIVHHYLVTAPVDLKKVREWLYNKNDLESSYQIVESWLQEKNTQEAQKALNDIGNRFKFTDQQQKIHEDYRKITDLKVKAMEQGRSIADFNETEVLALVELADRNLGRAAEQAKGILNFFYGYQYVTQQLPFPAEKVDSKIQNVVPIAEKAVLQTPSSVQVVPNPATHEVTFKYNLEGQEIRQGTLQVVDFTGKALQRFDLNDNIGEIRWTVNHLPPRLYFYSLKNGGRIIAFGKLVVNK